MLAMKVKYFSCVDRPKRKQSKPRPSLVPEPSSLRDFSLNSNTLDSTDESFSHYLSEKSRLSRPNGQQAPGRLADLRQPENSRKTSTFRPPVLLRTSANVAAAAAARASIQQQQQQQQQQQETSGRYRNFNDLWIRLDSGGNPHIR